MNYKKFTYSFIISFITIIMIIISFNYYFDPDAIFRQNKQIYYGPISDRYAKTSYILKNKEKYNTFIWGSSRVQKMDAFILNTRSYNMGATSGGVEDCLRGLKIFVNNRIKIENVYLGIDNFSYKYDNEKDIRSFHTTPYSEVKLKNIEYLMKAALKKPDYDKIKVYSCIENTELIENYLISSGKLMVPNLVEKNIEKSTKDYVYNEKFKKPLYVDDKNEHIDSTISIIKEIKQICDDNNINLVVFFNPVHITSYLKDDIEISNRFKKELANITDFYDFNYINFITVNNYFWYETSHPRYFVCDWQLKVITNQYDEKIPKDFGHLVTKENVDYYCNKYKIDKENFKMPEKQYIPEHPII